MDSPARGAWRPARALALATVTVALAASAHAAAGGMLPSLWALFALTVPTVCLAVLLTARRLSTPVVLGTLGTGQFLLHEGFQNLATGAHCTTNGTSHHQTVAACSTAVHHDPTSGMLLAHVLATLLTGVLLARGEQALWALADRLNPVLPVLARVNLPVQPRLPRHPEPLPTRPRIVDVAVPVRRGPPAGLRAAP